MRIVHFSDIHAGGRVNDLRGIFDKRLLGTLNHFLRRRHSHDWGRVGRAISLIKQLLPDIVICTGDLTTLSEPKEFEQAFQALETLATDQRFELLYVPGNHDCYVPNRDCQESLRRIFKTLNRERWDLDDLPAVFTFQHARFLLINQATPAPLYASWGEISKHTAARIEEHLSEESEQPTILVSHYPLFDADGYDLSWRRRCKNNECLQRAYREGHINLALCGHIHTPFVREEASGIMEVCAGSLTHAGRLNFVDLDTSTGQIEQRWIEVPDHDQPDPELAGATAPAR